MHVGIAVFELHLPAAHSLKDKRRVVRSLVERLHARLRLSIAEVGQHDLHQRAEIGVAAVAAREGEARALLAKVRAAVDGETEAVVVRWDEGIVEGTE